MFAPSKWRIEEHEVLGSTNTRAIELVREAFSRPDSHVDHIAIVAKRQTAGRGQHGRTWESPPGGIYLSAILQDIPIEWRPLLPIIAGVAIASAIQAMCNDTIKLRWPNDVLIGDKKVGGVLCESITQGSQWAAVIGIGINFNVPLESLPMQLRGTATSVHLHQLRLELPERVRVRVLGSLDLRLMLGQSKGITSVVNQARDLDYLLQKQIEFQLDNRTLTGTASGIGDNGELLVKVDNEILSLTSATLLSIDGESLRP